MIDLERLRRWPDIEAPNLSAVDATDRLLLDTARDWLAADPETAEEARVGPIAIIGDRYGALTLGLQSAWAEAGAPGEPGVTSQAAPRLRVHQDSLSGERALDANAEALGLERHHEHLGLTPDLVAGCRLVLLQLPRSLDALDEIAATIAAGAPADVTVLAGGRLKHMTVAMNEVLGRHFGEVRAGLARQKSRVLTARAPRPQPAPTPWPRSRRDAEFDLTVAAHAAAFAGPSVDIGTAELLRLLDRMPSVGEVVDLGCGTGVLAVSYARRHPSAHVVATDQSAAAVASARATAEANGVAVDVVRDDAGASLPAGSAELVLLNPPFHVGATVHAGIAHKMFEAAARLLAPGAELWCVWNSHLGHRPVLERVVGPTRQLVRTPVFTVTVSTRR
ncbi:class I SAM-dependent methyltransferase [Frigoribacterium sp. 2-23]|uniref:class I SAM-dependent methyltransferase n=1 Tax=Frigoribacterium sp. 2-23 TaxID=3415006 RepID=UPI003C6EC57C